MPPLPSTQPKPFKNEVSRDVVEPSKDEACLPDKSESIPDTFRIHTVQDEDLPAYPVDFNVAKYSIFHKDDSRTWCVLELQSAKGYKGRQYRVIAYWKDRTEQHDIVTFPSTSELAVEVYQNMIDSLLSSGQCLWTGSPPNDQNLGSYPLQQLLLEEKLNTRSLSQDVAVFVELLWTEALGCLGDVLRVPVQKLSLNDVSRAEGLLIQAQEKLNVAQHVTALELLNEVYTLLPHRKPNTACDAKLISQKLDLCQLIRDILNMNEMMLKSPTLSSFGKFRALRCSIEVVEPDCSEYTTVSSLLQDRAVHIHQVLRVSRAVELQTFNSKLGNVKSLLHSSSPSNFVGILSRGLLLPCVGVMKHGIVRTDAGRLGNGIYFTNSMSTCLKYSKPSATDGSRLLLVCDVALGHSRQMRDLVIGEARKMDRIHDVAEVNSLFMGDEYMVYSPDQVMLKYVVRFSLDGDELKAFSPAVDTSVETTPTPSSSVAFPDDDDDSFGSIITGLDDVTSGLLDSSGQQLPLLAVHIKCKLIDLLSHVIIFQKYTNLSNVPIEAKYVFPLDEYAAVCGFEAFINGKHVVGQVKEKETARKQYKQAIEKGHGAYLMDQDAPDVFTISVGNLPAGASVLIKVTFVSELIIKDGSIFFSLPGSVAPWQESAALNQTTQVTVQKVCVTDDAASTREFSLDMSIEMQNEISSLQCITHEVKIKRTDCKAVVRVLPGQVMYPEGFQLSVTLSDVHLPRMWVEEHPDKDSQACMLVFYPKFDIKPTSGSNEVIILLDTSKSMNGDLLFHAQKIALHTIKTLKGDWKINVFLFGIDHKQAFLTAQPLDKARQDALKFVQEISPMGGTTELWRPLQALALLPPTCGFRNLFLLSDGHIQNANTTLQLLRDNVEHSRLFVCGLSSTANRHMLGALAQAGCGAYEYFNAKQKHKWAEKVARQVRRMESPVCSSVSVKWQQFTRSAPPPVQAPRQLHALFNDCHTLVYGFVQNCTQACLYGNLSGQELTTMVSTSELQKTRGTFLHKLTARALIRDYEDGNLHSNEAEHESEKSQLKSFIIDLSKEFSILSQFTSFVAIEEREPVQAEQGFTDIPKLLAEEDVDILPYIDWTSSQADGEVDEDFALWGIQKSLGACWDNIMEPPNILASDEDEEILPYIKCESSLADVEEEEGFAEMPLHRIQSEKKSSSAVSYPSFAPQKSVKRFKLKSDGFGTMDTEVLHPSFLPVPESIPMAFAAGPPPLATRHSLESLPLPPADSPSVFHPVSLAVQPPLGSSLLVPPSPHTGSLSFVALPPPPPPPQQLHSVVLEAAPSPCEEHLTRAGSPSSVDLPPTPPPTPRRRCISSFSSKSKRRAEKISQIPFELSNIELKDMEFQFSGPSRSSLAISDRLAKLPFKRSLGLTPSFGHVRSTYDADGGPPLPEYQSPAPSSNSSGGIGDQCTTNRGLDEFRRPKALKKKLLERQGSTLSAENKSTPLGYLLEDSIKAAPDKVSFKKGTPQPSVFLYPGTTAHMTHRTMYSEASFDMVPQIWNWSKIFQMQISDGFWELTGKLAKFVDMDLDVFVNEFLESKGIRSLGVKARADILRLLATLLVLQMMRLAKLPEGVLLRTLFCLEDAPVRPNHWQEVKKAVDWARWADRQYPCICSRLEFGLTWESATRQLLGHDDIPAFSPLAGLKLRTNMSAALDSVVVS
ncbi:protein mono-ADP-ribosyltransferase PARP4 isoform X2 [Corythoichthys intestinalis]|nr:protein mono-ADP-ribosyltransferase PARP4 isoform X2 [Corythoichthys intestinalis]